MVVELKKAWTDNKIVMSACGVVIAGLMAWGIWVTKGVFSAEFNESTLKAMCTDVERMKKIDEGLRLQAEVLAVKFETQTLKMELNQKEIMTKQDDLMRVLSKKEKSLGRSSND